MNDDFKRKKPSFVQFLNEVMEEVFDAQREYKEKWLGAMDTILSEGVEINNENCDNRFNTIQREVSRT